MATVVILDGSRDGDELAAARDVLQRTLDQRRHDTTVLPLRNMHLAPCAGCFGCWVKTPGVCVIDDDARVIARAMVGSDLLIYLTPVTFGGYSSVLKRALDRQICLVMPYFTMRGGEVHHRKRYAHYPRFAALGLLPEPDAEAEAIFTALVERNARNFDSPAHASAVVYADQGEAEMATAVQGMLSAVEVGQ